MVKSRYAGPVDNHPIRYITELEALGTDASWFIFRGAGMGQSLFLSPKVMLDIVSYAIRHFYISIPQVLRIAARMIEKRK